MKPDESQSQNAPTERQVSVIDLKAWSAHLSTISDNFSDARKALSRDDRKLSIAAMDNAQHTAEFVRDEIEAYIKRERNSFACLREDAAILADEDELKKVHFEIWKRRRFKKGTP